MADWKDTCNLPRTPFSMKANLQTTEPETIARWEGRFPGLVLPAVRRLIAYGKAPGAGEPIWDYAPNAAEDYAEVMAAILPRLSRNLVRQAVPE